MKQAILVLLAVLLLGGIGVYFFLSKPAPPPPPESPVVEEPVASPSQSPEPAAEPPQATVSEASTPDQTEPDEPVFRFPEPPSLEDSDVYLSVVFEQEKEQNPAMDETLRHRHKIRHSVTAVDRILRGENPNRQLGFLQPPGEVQVRQSNGKIYLSQDNYSRYEPMIAALETVDTRKMALLYNHLHTLFKGAYDELGNADNAWDVKLSQFISKVLAVKVPRGEIELSGGQGVYIFADPRLEESTAFEKAFIRMGPENTRRIKKKFRELRQALREN